MVTGQPGQPGRLLRCGVPGGHGDPVQVVRQDDLAAECRLRLPGEPLAALMVVALGEMGKHQQSRPRLGRDAACLPGGEVPVLARERALGVGEGRLTHHHVGALSQRERGITQAGVHDERKPLAPSGLTHLLNPHHPAGGCQAALTLQPPDVGTGNAERGELGREHPPPIRLHQLAVAGLAAVLLASACDTSEQVPWATYNSGLQVQIDAATVRGDCPALRALLNAAKASSEAHEKATGFPNDTLVSYIQSAQQRAGCPS